MNHRQVPELTVLLGEGEQVAVAVGARMESCAVEQEACEEGVDGRMFGVREGEEESGEADGFIAEVGAGE